jgi:hypothetical protein
MAAQAAIHANLGWLFAEVISDSAFRFAHIALW